MMKIRYAVPATLFALAMLGATPALAQQGMSMEIVEDPEASEADYASQIELPPQAGGGEGDDEENGGFEEAKENAPEEAQPGLNVATEARKLEAAREAGPEEFKEQLKAVIEAARSINADSVRNEIPASEGRDRP